MRDGDEETTETVVATVSLLAERLSLWLVAGVGGISGDATAVSGCAWWE